MATLPIGITDIITPYNVYGEEKSSVYESINNRTYVTRQGGYRYRVTLTIKPFTLLSNEAAARFDHLKAFLQYYPQFSVPAINNAPNEFTPLLDVSNDPLPIYIDDTAPAGYNQPGDELVRYEAGNVASGFFYPGQYVKFSNKDKVYQVLANGNTEIGLGPTDIRLSQRLRQTLVPTAASPTTKQIIWQEADGLGVMFNGVTLGVTNQDFGSSVTRVEEGVLAIVGPLSLVESI